MEPAHAFRGKAPKAKVLTPTNGKRTKRPGLTLLPFDTLPSSREKGDSSPVFSPDSTSPSAASDAAGGATPQPRAGLQEICGDSLTVPSVVYRDGEEPPAYMSGTKASSAKALAQPLPSWVTLHGTPTMLKLNPKAAAKLPARATPATLTRPRPASAPRLQSHTSGAGPTSPPFVTGGGHSQLEALSTGRAARRERYRRTRRGSEEANHQRRLLQLAAGSPVELPSYMAETASSSATKEDNRKGAAHNKTKPRSSQKPPRSASPGDNNPPARDAVAPQTGGRRRKRVLSFSQAMKERGAKPAPKTVASSPSPEQVAAAALGRATLRPL